MKLVKEVQNFGGRYINSEIKSIILFLIFRVGLTEKYK